MSVMGTKIGLQWRILLASLKTEIVTRDGVIYRSPGVDNT